MICVEHLTVSYGGHRALDDVSLCVAPGEFVLLTGPSGCGKSTLARVIAGLIPHAIPARARGRVTLAGLNTFEQPIPTLVQHVGMVFQNPASQLFHLRVDDEVAFGLRNLGLDEAEITRRVDWALSAVGLAGLEACKPVELSGGQKQRLAIAAVLAMRPRVLVLDEPTASLDIHGTRQVMSTLQALHQQYNLTVVLIEHRLADAVWLAHRVVLMNGGRIEADGPVNAVLSNAETRRRLGLRRPGEHPQTAWDKLVTDNGRRPADTAPLLSLHGVSAGYNAHPVIQNVDVSIYPGDFMALVGDNGAGKSTLGLVAAGLLKPLQGRVAYRDGKQPRPGLDVALLFQNPAEQLFTNSVDEEVAFGPQNYDLFDETRHQQTLNVADLSGLRTRQPFTLSAGQQQRAALAACMALRPGLLILDEPTQGQDWGHLQRLMDFLAELNQRGASILLISHDYKLVHRYASRVVLMADGRIVVDGHIPRPNPNSRSL
jgi:energy-coupling factor transport system ATP-binding protein